MFVAWKYTAREIVGVKVERFLKIILKISKLNKSKSSFKNVPAACLTAKHFFPLPYLYNCSVTWEVFIFSLGIVQHPGLWIYKNSTKCMSTSLKNERNKLKPWTLLNPTLFFSPRKTNSCKMSWTCWWKDWLWVYIVMNRFILKIKP